MEIIPLREGLRCGQAESYFACDGCHSQQTRIAAEGALGARGGVECCGFRCGALYEEQALAVHCTPEAYARYQQARVQYVQATAKRDVVQRLEAERLRLEVLPKADRRAQQVYRHIVEEILTLKCPRCRKEFVDFDACFALRCRNAADNGCRAEFCAFCLALCGTNAHAHQHVAQCPFNINPGRDVFGSLENFDEAQQRRRERLLWKYLAPMTMTLV